MYLQGCFSRYSRVMQAADGFRIYTDFLSLFSGFGFRGAFSPWHLYTDLLSGSITRRMETFA